MTTVSCNDFKVTNLLFIIKVGPTNYDKFEDKCVFRLNNISYFEVFFIYPTSKMF